MRLFWFDKVLRKAWYDMCVRSQPSILLVICVLWQDLVLKRNHVSMQQEQISTHFDSNLTITAPLGTGRLVNFIQFNYPTAPENLCPRCLMPIWECICRKYIIRK
jgi:hypothetical protein